MASAPVDQSVLLKEVLETLKSLQINQTALASDVDAIAGRVNVLAGMKEVRDVATESSPSIPVKKIEPITSTDDSHHDDVVPQSPSLPATSLDGEGGGNQVSHARKTSVTSRIILTTYPNQSGINPLPMDWGNKDFQQRGPVVVSRNPTTIRRRNGMSSIQSSSE
jgi:hypothetical protein